MIRFWEERYLECLGQRGDDLLRGGVGQAAEDDVDVGPAVGADVLQLGQHRQVLR